MFTGKKIILGVTGSIAAYKIATLASMLKKRGGDITVIMTENATNFITPITLETLTGNKCLVDTFDRNFEFQVEHVSLAKQADVFLLAPASANVIGKIAGGIADDMLTTTFLACECPACTATGSCRIIWTNAGTMVWKSSPPPPAIWPVEIRETAKCPNRKHCSRHWSGPSLSPKICPACTSL